MIWKDPELNTLLESSTLAIGSLKSYSELIPNIDLYIKMHVLTEAHNSNKIEGTKTTIEEDLMKLEDLPLKKRDDVQEVHNYMEALNYGIQKITIDNFPLSTRLLRDIHSILLKGVRGTHKTPGEFRYSQNWIGGSKPDNAIFVPPSSEHVISLMSDLELFIHNEEIKVPHLIKLALIHYQFESIHPFLVGNGRLSRLIIPLYLLNYGILDKPSFYVSNYLEKNRNEYYSALTRVRENGELIYWIKFFIKAMISTADDVKTKFSNVVSTVEKYNSLILDVKGRPENIAKIMREFYNDPILSITSITERTGLSRNSVHSIVNNLEEKGILKEITGYSRNKIFALYEYYSIFASNS